jgi:hypothetical protein
MVVEAKDITYTLGILLTFAVSVWGLVVGLRNTRKTNFINTVTSQRVKWIEQLRQDIGSLCGLTHTWFYSSLEGTQKEHDVLKEIDRLRHVIPLRLNQNAPLDRNIQKLITDLPKLTHETKQQQLDAALSELIGLSQKLLKEEWEKVKLEAVKGDLKG